jgi:TonB family protein
MTALIVEAALRSLVLAMLVWVAVATLRIRNPHLEKTLWTVVLGCALAMPALMQWPLSQQIPIASTVLTDISIGGVLSRASPWSLSAFAWLYALVAVVLALRLAIGGLRMWQIRRRAVRLHWVEGVDIRASADLTSPVTFGSAILLPADCSMWSEPKRAAVLAHERQHVGSRDCEIQWVAAVHVCLFWFSPLSWWLRGRLGKLAEDSSDDAALRCTPDRAEYASLLLEAAQSRCSPPLAIPMAGGSLGRRIDRVLSERSLCDVPAPWRRALLAVLVLPAAALAAGTAGPGAAAQGANDSATTAKADNAYIVSYGGNIAAWYPSVAKQNGVKGLVRIAVTLDEAGQLRDTLIVSESPEGMGFGDAAKGVAQTFSYANPTGHPTTLVFNVKFELTEGGSSHHGTTNFESAEAQEPPGH